MSNPLADLLSTGGPPYAAPRGRPQHPEGWEPGVTYDTAKGQGTITGQVDNPNPGEADWDHLLKAWGFDPTRYHVDETYGVNVRTWEAFAKAPDGSIETKQLWYVKATIKAGAALRAEDLEPLMAEIRKHKPRKTPTFDGQPRTLVVCLADFQTGKDEGGGTEALVARVLRLVDDVATRITVLRRMGRPITRLVILGLGDLHEGCDGHYAMQSFLVELDRRQQTTVVRRLILKCIEAWAPLVERVTVACVPGNHGENRKNGKAFTSFGDNDDVAVFEQVADVLAANPDAYGHVSFVIPRNELSVTLDVHGVRLGLIHGHQATSGSGPQKKVENWWKGQALGQTLIGDVDVLVSGHYHHLQVVSFGPRTWFQCPALDGGSKWWTDQSGLHSSPGVLTFTVTADGWSDLAVL